jgi:hypothetical protein
MRHALELHLTAAEQRTISRWSIAASSPLALLALLLAGAALVTTPPETKHQAQYTLATVTCSPWDAAARDALAVLVREPSDAALRHVGDALFRLRRARRNCEHGWVRLACQDYHAVMSVSSAGTPLPATSAVCWPAL